MPWPMVTNTGTSTASAGKLYLARPTAPTITALQFRQVTLPTGVNCVSTRGSSVSYGSRWYTTGTATENLLVDEYYRCHRQGIQPPVEIPVIAAGAGTGRTGSCIPYISFYDAKTEERSSLSGGGVAVSLTNQNAAWSNLPTTCQDTRVTDLEYWVSVDGETPRLIMRRQLGRTTATEGVATLALGEAFTDTFERMPRGSVNAIYHDRQAVAGNAIEPDVIYLSSPFKPERYGQLSFKTRNGEKVVGLVATRSVLLVLCPRTAYALRGWDESDMTLEPLDGDFGLISHQLLQMNNGSVYGVDAQGPWLYNGGFHRIGNDFSTMWKESYRSDPASFNNAFSVQDPNEETYSILMAGLATAFGVGPSLGLESTPAVSPGTLGWVAQYGACTPELSGSMSQPEWMFDTTGRATYSAALLALPGATRADVYWGGADGYIRKRDPADFTDDSDTEGKTMIIRTGANTFADPGGDRQSGWSFGEQWSYIDRESATAFTVIFRAGDEELMSEGSSVRAADNTSIWWKDSITNAQLVDTSWTYSRKTVHVHNLARVTGRTLTQQVVIPNAINARYSGFGGFRIPGKASRPPVGVGSGG